MTSVGSQVLEYRRPQVFFEGHYSFRSWRAILGLVLCGGFGATTAYIAFAQIGHTLTGLFVIAPFAAGFNLAACYLAWGYISNRNILIQINEDGIRDGRKFWRWGEIAQFGAKRYSGEIQPYFIFRGGKFRQMILTPAMPEERYIAAAKRLKANLADRFPQVCIVLHSD